MIELRSLGTAQIKTSSATITPSQTIVFGASLYLIMERGKPVSRTALASLLWPNGRHQDQIHRLRQTVYQLKTLGVVARTNRSALELRREDAKTDVDDLGGLDLTASDLHTALEFLPGYTPPISETFQEWLDSLRARVHADLNQALLTALRGARNAGKWIDVDRISTHCLRLDAYNEAAVLAKAEACAMRGQKAAAVSLLDQFVAELEPINPTLVLPATVLRKRVLQEDGRGSPFSAASREPDFVGRGPEMSSLTQLVERARKGAGSGCLIEGEPGIGKTRLSSELAKFAELQGLRVERVACKRADTEQPLSAFVALIPRLRELPGALGCAHESLLRLRRLTEFDTSTQKPPTLADDSASLYTHLRSAVFDLLDSVAYERSLLVIVEDVQWLDRASAKLFAAILEWVCSKKILFVFNSRETGNPLTEVISAKQIAVIQLKPLENRDAVALTRTVVAESGESLQESDLHWLINTGDGNPYFLQELAKHWIESGRRNDVPASVAAVLNERLSRLSGVAGQLLQTCAVLAENSNLDRLERALEYRPSDLLAGIQELSTSGMLRFTLPSEEQTQSLLVRHDLLSTQALNCLSPSALAYLHRRCAVVLEREALGTSISISLIRGCAFHWFHSGDSERAYDLAIKCADHLLEIGLASDAEKAFEGALAFCSSAERRVEILRRIIQANRMARDWSALLHTVARLRTLQNGGSTSAHHDEIEIMEFEACRTTEIELRPSLSKMLACVYDASLPVSHRVEVAGVAVKLASSIPDLGELERVYNAVKPLLDDVSVGTRPRLQIEVIYNTMCGDLRQAARFAKERVAYERAEGIPTQIIQSLTDLAFVLRRAGPFEEMVEALRNGYATAVEAKNYAAARDCAGKLGSLLEDEGHPGSEIWMQRAGEGRTDPSDLHSNFSFNADSTRIALREERLADARQVLDNEFDWQWLGQRRAWLAAALGLRIRLLMAEGSAVERVAVEIEELQRAYSFTAGLGRQDYEVAALVRGLVYIGQPTRAKTQLEDYIFCRRRDLVPYSKELAELARSLRIAESRSLSNRSQLPSFGKGELSADRRS